MKTLVISPHPDDELLGMGGTLLKRKKNQQNRLFWMIATKIKKSQSNKIKKNREQEIKKIIKIFGFEKVFFLNYETTSLDTVPKKDLVKKISKVIMEIKPDEIFGPHKGDVHSDHKIINETLPTVTKSFRYPYIKKVLTYEVLSETDFNLYKKEGFFPNYFIDISKEIKKKLEICKIYKSEFKKFPFPRSLKNVQNLAMLRGSRIGVKSAEAFELIYENEK